MGAALIEWACAACSLGPAPLAWQHAAFDDYAFHRRGRMVGAVRWCRVGLIIIAALASATTPSNARHDIATHIAHRYFSAPMPSQLAANGANIVIRTPIMLNILRLGVMLMSSSSTAARISTMRDTLATWCGVHDCHG